MGISLGQIITPLIIKNAEDIQMMNIIWFVPAAMGKENSFYLHRNVQNGFELDCLILRARFSFICDILESIHYNLVQKKVK